MKYSWFERHIDLMAGLALAILPALLYPLAATRQGVFYVGDIFRLHYPLRSVYAETLRHGTLPLWTPDVLAGFPLLAEGQTGVFYPFNLLLYRFLPIDLALNYSILLALSLAGVAAYWLGRTLRLRPAAAFLTALTFTYAGFSVGHFNHLNIMAAISWLPLQLAIVEKTVARRRTWGVQAAAVLVAALGLAVGVQFLAGHPQIWLMSALVLLSFGLFRARWPAAGHRRSFSQAARVFAPVVLAVAVGIAIAAAQLLPTWELAQQSVRAGGLSTDAFAQFSWHPGLLATLLVPFALGNPYPDISVELAAYLGLLPLTLALAAPVLRRDRLSAFLVGLAGFSLLLAFGDYTPFYAPLARIPVLNLFRVPARFLYPFTLAMALLAGRSLDALLSRFAEPRPGKDPLHRRWLRATVALGGAAAGVTAIQAASLDTLLALRWVLPGVTFALVAGLLTLTWRRRIGRRTLLWTAIGLTLVDLYAFGAVYRLTYNDLMPPSEFYDKPAALSFFPEDTQHYRTRTREAIVPALSVMRASLYPNISLLHGISSANGYFPLLPARHARYLTNLTPSRLNLLNGRYFLIPQLLPVDPETERYDLHNPFTPDLVDQTVAIPPTRAESLELKSFTSQSAGWQQGERVADIILTSRDGETVTLPVRAGQHTAEWAYARSDVTEQIAHERPPVARIWPARSGYPREDHPGHVYRARYRLPTELEVTQVEVAPAKPAGLFHIEEMALIAGNQRHTMAGLLGLGRHQLAYRDLDVVIYDNLDALPRAFVVHQARIAADDEAALSTIDDPRFDPRAEVLLAGHSAEGGGSPPPKLGKLQGAKASKPTAQITHYSPHHVEIQTELDQSGYLVLLDSYYPGWQAAVDGEPATIQRANVLFRAVALEAGRHTVTFTYDPLTLKAGAVISLATLAGLALIGGVLVLRHKSVANHAP